MTVLLLNRKEIELTSQALLHTLDRYPSIARLIFLKLRSLLVAEGESVPYAEDASVDQAVLTDLGQRLRRFREIDWAPADPSRRRRPSSRPYPR